LEVRSAQSCPSIVQGANKLGRIRHEALLLVLHRIVSGPPVDKTDHRGNSTSDHAR
jgi:hypothetical protein